MSSPSDSEKKTRAGPLKPNNIVTAVAIKRYLKASPIHRMYNKKEGTKATRTKVTSGGKKGRVDSDDRRIPGRVNTYTVVARLVAALVGTVVENALEFKASMTGTKEYFKDSAKDSKKRKRKIGEGKLDIAHVVFGAANNPSTRTRFLRLMTHRAPVIQTGFDIGNLDRHCPSLRESGIRRMIEHKRRLMRNKHRRCSKRKKSGITTRNFSHKSDRVLLP